MDRLEIPKISFLATSAERASILTAYQNLRKKQLSFRSTGDAITAYSARNAILRSSGKAF